MRHVLDAGSECLDNGFAVVLVFHDKSTIELRFKLLEMIVNQVTSLVSDAYNHKF